MLCLWGFWRWLTLRTTRQSTGAQTVGGSLIIRARRRGLAEDLPRLLRWLAWFVESNSNMAAPDRLVDAVGAIDRDLASTPPATDFIPPRERGL